MSPTPKILVVEDEAMLLKAILTRLKNRNCEAKGFKNAEEAYELMKSGEFLPDVIWLDFYLPGGMNGLSFVKILKKNPKWAKIPVVVVSNTAGEEKVEEMLVLGIDKYLLKAEHHLDEVIDHMVSLAQSEEWKHAKN